jgi:UDP-N-acetylmuramoyl-tripeptide--D-alanyl-D-alanine ligase
VRRISFQNILDSTGARMVHGDASKTDLEITEVSTDTRTLSENQFFLSLDGPSFDGNRFAQDALRAGASALLFRAGAAYDLTGIGKDVLVCEHPNPRRALSDLGAWYRSTLKCPVLAITGSCGKTTTKNLIRDLVSASLRTVVSPSSFNNDIGVPHTIFLADEKTELLAIEMGSNHSGEIAALCRVARPTAGILTNVGASHLEGLGSLDGVAREKGDLAASLPREGFCVLNADCRFTPEVRSRTSARVITFSIEGHDDAPGGKGDLDATDLFCHSGGTTFKLNGQEVTSPLLGTHNVQNLLAALAACVGLGLDLDTVLHSVSNIRGGRQRMERIELPGITVFDDSYNSNPESLRAAVRVLSGLHGFKRRVLVLGDMLELGELAAELHHEVGREAAKAGIDRILLVGELARAAAAGALEGGLTAEAVLHVSSTDEARRVIGGLVTDGDVVLIKGSRRMRLEAVVNTLIEQRASQAT